MKSVRVAPNATETPVVILCGGAGTRLREETVVIPKPMVTVGGKPMLWHLMQYYASFGYRRFVLCLGYKSEVIKNYCLNLHHLSNSFSIRYGDLPVVEFHDTKQIVPWSISCVDTGDFAMTGARIKRAQPFLDGGRFLLTYGDGLADVDLEELVLAHERADALVTVTGVHPPSRFGLLRLDGTKVTHFSEKTQVRNDYINGGFFVCEPGVFDYLEDDDACVFERGPLERLAADGELSAFLHESFWQCMDTMRDREILEEAWITGAPWRRW